jgi:hypothetical protein
VVVAVILGVLVVIFYFACFAGNSTKINPNRDSITISNGKDDNHKNMTFQTNSDSQTKYVVQNLDIKNHPNNNGLL